jgi:outer membrane protein OmpA-like peptidoglycan-associated protein
LAADAAARDAAAREAARREQELAAEAAAREAAAQRERQPASVTFPVILFAPDSTQLSESERAKLREVANTLRTIPDARVMIAGHSAEAVSREGQLRISLERANTVASFLVSLGISRQSLTVFGYGAENPAANNRTAAGMAANRRVEITILGD